MNRVESQQQEEMRVFREFVAVCPLPLLMDSAENRPPSHPDILCSLSNGDSLAFELGQAEDVTTYDNAKGKTYVASIQKKDRDGDHSASYVRTAILERVQDKLNKTYETDAQIHLVVWSLTARASEAEIWHKELALLLQTNGMGPFQRIWVFGCGNGSIVFDSGDAN